MTDWSAEEFDCIVVGAGSAGCVVAARLAEAGQTVLLLEAGGEDRNPWIHVPLGYGKLFNDARHNWMYESEPEPYLGDRQTFQPRGKVLGGTSSINGLLYVRGQAADYDAWRDAGNAGWGYSDVLPWFKKSQHQVRGASTFHGVGGPLWVSDQPQSHPIADAFIEAAADCGFARNADFNGAAQSGAGYFQATTRRGRRCSASAFLRGLPASARLKVVTRALVSRLLIEQGACVGVEYTGVQGLRRVRARREVVLAAGVFNTPHLLQVSGVGDPHKLSSAGIELKHALPGVGLNLQDHLRSSLVFVASKPVTHNDLMRGWSRKALAAMQYLLTRKGPLATGLYAGGFFSTTDAKRPDVQVTVWTSSLKRRDARGVELHDFSGFTMNAIVLRPASRGEVRARSANMADAPAIRFNYAECEEDVQTAVRGIGLVRRLAARGPLANMIAREHSPGPQTQSVAELTAFVHQQSGATFHAVGTCKMGADALAVVDSRLRVHGLGQLRVADASVMPLIPSGNTHAPTVMIAERAASFVLGEALA